MEEEDEDSHTNGVNSSLSETVRSTDQNTCSHQLYYMLGVCVCVCVCRWMWWRTLHQYPRKQELMKKLHLTAPLKLLHRYMYIVCTDILIFTVIYIDI